MALNRIQFERLSVDEMYFNLIWMVASITGRTSEEVRNVIFFTYIYDTHIKA